MFLLLLWGLSGFAIPIIAVRWDRTKLLWLVVPWVLALTTVREYTTKEDMGAMISVNDGYMQTETGFYQIRDSVLHPTHVTKVTREFWFLGVKETTVRYDAN